MAVPDWRKAAGDDPRLSELLGLLGLLSLAMLLASLVAIPWLLCRLPEDYLCPEARSVPPGLARRVVRNTLGVVLVLLGVLMLVLPGQGLLTIFCGLTLLDFPRKRQLIARLLGRPRVLSVVNSIRRRLGRPPLRQ